MSIGDFQGSLSQAMLVGTMLVGRLGVRGGGGCRLSREKAYGFQPSSLGTAVRGTRLGAAHVFQLGDSKNTVSGYCLDIPRFKESLND